MKGIPQIAMKSGGVPRELCPQKPSTPASQKMANPPHKRLKGIMYQSSEWKITLGFGLPAPEETLLGTQLRLKLQ